MTEVDKNDLLRHALWQVMDLWEDDDLTDEEKLLSIMETAREALTKVNSGKGRRP